MEGFDLLVKWMAKHLPSLDLSGLVVDDVEKELISDHPTKATMENVMEETTDVAEGMEEATIVTPTDPVPDHYLFFFQSFFFFNLFPCKARTIFLFGLVVLGN